MYIHACMYTYIHTYIYMYIYACTFTYIYVLSAGPRPEHGGFAWILSGAKHTYIFTHIHTYVLTYIHMSCRWVQKALLAPGESLEQWEDWESVVSMHVCEHGPFEYECMQAWTLVVVCA